MSNRQHTYTAQGTRTNSDDTHRGTVIEGARWCNRPVGTRVALEAKQGSKWHGGQAEGRVALWPILPTNRGTMIEENSSQPGVGCARWYIDQSA